jgi:hypothetical protein
VTTLRDLLKTAEESDSYIRQVGRMAPYMAIKQLSDLPKGAIEKAVEQKVLGKPVRVGKVLGSGAGRYGGATIGLATGPLFVDGARKLSDDDPKVRMRGAAQIGLASSIYAAAKGAGQGLGGGSSLSAAMRRAASRTAVNLPVALTTALAISDSHKKKRGPLATAAIGAGAGAVGGGVKGTFEGLLESGMKDRSFRPSPKQLRFIGSRGAARAASGGVGGLVLGGLFGALAKSLKKKDTEKKAAAERDDGPGYGSTVARAAPVYAAIQAAKVPAGAAQTAVENKLLGRPANLRKALRSGVGMGAASYGAGLATLPLYLSGLNDLQSDDPGTRRAGMAKVLGQSAVQTAAQTTGYAKALGLPMGETLARAGSKTLLRMPIVAATALSLGSGKGRENEGPGAKALRSGATAVVVGSGIGALEPVVETVLKRSPAGLPLWRKMLARSAGTSLQAGLGAAALGGLYGALKKDIKGEEKEAGLADIFRVAKMLPKATQKVMTDPASLARLLPSAQRTAARTVLPRMIPTGIGAGIGTLAADEGNHLSGALTGAGVGAGISYGMGHLSKALANKVIRNAAAAGV